MKSIPPVSKSQYIADMAMAYLYVLSQKYLYDLVKTRETGKFSDIQLKNLLANSIVHNRLMAEQREERARPHGSVALVHVYEL
jgi:hypothetical protein